MSHPPRFDLERWVALEMDKNEARSIQEHLGVCEICKQYVSKLKEDQDQLLQKATPQVFAQLVQKRSSSVQPARINPLWLWGSVGALAAATALLLVLLVPFRSGIKNEEGGIRWMGSGGIVNVYLDRDGKTFKLEQHKVVPGDRMRYEVVLPPGQKGYAALLAIEGTKIFPLLPEDSQKPPFLVSGSLLVPGSVLLESGGKVRLLFMVRPQPYTLDQLIAEVKQAMVTGGLEAISGAVHQMEVDLDMP